QDGSAFIDYYERTVNGRIERWAPEDVVHFRNLPNPANPRLGTAPIKAALLQVFADEEIDAWVASLAKNMGVPGVVIAPGDSNVMLTPKQADEIKERFERRFTGEGRGGTLVLDFNATLEAFGYNPEQMNFRAVHDHAESRIAGALGVAPAVVFHNVGNEASTYNNITTLEKMSWQAGIVPIYENWEDTLDLQLLPDFVERPGERGFYCLFNREGIRPLHDDIDQKETRILKRVEAGLMRVDQAQAALGMESDPAAAYYLIPQKWAPATAEAAAAAAAKYEPGARASATGGNDPLADKAFFEGDTFDMLPEATGGYYLAPRPARLLLGGHQKKTLNGRG
ncbi:MAG: phage portal protein, partial [Hyphomicrobiaceae bacterium]